MNKAKVSKVAISAGVLSGIIMMVIYLLIAISSGMLDSYESYYNYWWIIDIGISILIYIISGFITGIVAGYRSYIHGLWVAIIMTIIFQSVMYLMGNKELGIISIIIASLVSSLFTMIGCTIGVVCHRRKTVCPECLKSTVLKTILNGSNKGQKIYICSNYPECRGRIKA